MDHSCTVCLSKASITFCISKLACAEGFLRSLNRTSEVAWLKGPQKHSFQNKCMRAYVQTQTKIQTYLSTRAHVHVHVHVHVHSAIFHGRE
jgi:hypothetical protein